MARRLRQVIDLYTAGKVCELKGGTPLWVQPLNPFEQDTARSEAQIARARIAMAIREEGHDERQSVREWFLSEGREAAADRLVSAYVSQRTQKIIDDMRSDEDWSEKLTILERGTRETAAPLEKEEEQLLLRIANEYSAELGKRISAEREYQIDTIERLDDEQLWNDFLTWYIDERSSDVMLTEFRLHQILYGVRWCDAVKDDEGNWDHSECDGHAEPLFGNKSEARAAPGDLLELLNAAMDDSDMTVREAKNSHRQGSSSDSSPLPSEEAASTASTPSGAPAEHPGSSS